MNLRSSLIVSTLVSAWATTACGAGEISFVLPFDYLRIVFGFMFGILWFGEIPEIWSYAGGATIVLSSIYLLRMEAGKTSP